jgi:hypothetical protein
MVEHATQAVAEGDQLRIGIDARRGRRILRRRPLRVRLLGILRIAGLDDGRARTQAAYTDDRQKQDESQTTKNLQ